MEMCFLGIFHVQKKGQGEKRRAESGQKRDTGCLFYLGQTRGHLITPPSVQAGCGDAGLLCHSSGHCFLGSS